MSIVAPDGKKLNNVPQVKVVHPFGSSILIEHLNSDEIIGSSVLHIQDDVKYEGAPQAYILELGKNVDPEIGLKVGDRVIVQGTFVPVVNTDDNGRARGIVEIHNIKAVLEETSIIN